MPISGEFCELDAWIEPERAFSALSGHQPNVFWLDDALGDGWSYVGHGDEISVTVPSPLLGAGSRHGDDPPFRSGWVGWHGYEGDARFLRVDGMHAFHHPTGRVFRRGAPLAPSTEPAAASAAGPAVTGHWRHSDDDYLRMIHACQSAIRAGDAYQLCLTNMWHAPQRAGGDETIWHRLRRANPSHHGGFLRIGDTTLLSTSPEQFIAIEGDTIRTRPIKGTRPRGGTEDQDAALAAELSGSTKERAENLMIVDLMRNDLALVAEVGSVSVPELLVVERYRHVHQLVSTVTARLRAGLDLAAVIAALFPAGSMTGAPKISAMAILRRLERGPRGVYSGVFGYIGDDGTVDLAMVIRSIVLNPQGTWIGAGGGITVLSDPAAELAEQKLKAAALIAALAPGGALSRKA
jgi:anthranilate/para-aminobenzoate synthase component I